jgi:hypothetical protein
LTRDSTRPSAQLSLAEMTISSLPRILKRARAPWQGLYPSSIFRSVRGRGSEISPLRHEFLAFIEQARGVHRGLHIVTIFLFAVWPLPLFAASLLPAHALELVVGKPQELLGARARKKDALILHDFRSNGVLCDALGKQNVQRRGIALRR